jgi:hypothetical protein
MSYSKFMLSVVGVTAPKGPVPPHCRRFTITLWHTTVGRTLWPIDQPNANLYLTTQDTDKRRTCMSRWGSNPHSQQARATFPRLRPRGHRDRPSFWSGSRDYVNNVVTEYQWLTESGEITLWLLRSVSKRVFLAFCPPCARKQDHIITLPYFS